MVAAAFAQSFGGERERPLVLYGLGRNTEAILRVCPEIEVAGVMGPDADGPVWQGKQVLCPQEAAQLGADIVIVARDSVVPLIYRRIAALEAQGVRIFRIDNTRLSGSAGQWDSENLSYWRRTKEELKRLIDEAEYVSFDIFDTLLGRRILRPEGLYAAVERRFPGGFQTECAFAEARQKAERALGPAAGVEAIYQYVRKALALSPAVTAQLMKLEWELEQETVYLREDMGELFRQAEERSKCALISDMFWSSEQLRCLLASQGLKTDVPIFVSCEAGCSKEDGGLYASYLERIGVRPANCLHIGDNRYADIEAARSAGLTVCQVLSGRQMLEASAAQGLLNCAKTEADSETVGKWISRQCSSPFALHHKRGRFFVETPYELGFSYLGPLLDFWLDWLRGQLRESGLKRMLFPARDGYLVQKLYELLRETEPELPPSIYFKASRRAVTVAALFDAEHVYEAAARGFHGSTRDFFQRRFGVTVDDDVPWEGEGPAARRLLSNAMSEILLHAEEERECYLNYLNSLGLPGEGKSGFFDFVAGGTVQHFYERLTGGKAKGFYFATANLPNRFYALGEIAAPFGNITSYGCSSPLAEHYIMLENVLTDPDTTLVRAARDGKMVYANGKNAAWPVIEQIQQGIFDYVVERLNRRELPAGKMAALRIFQLLFDGSVIAAPQLRSWFMYEDEYDGAISERCWNDIDS